MYLRTMCFFVQGPRGTARLMFAISTRHCTVFKALSVLHDIDSLSFCCFFRQRDKGKRANRSKTENNNLPTAHSPQQQPPPRLTAVATAAAKPPPRLTVVATAAETYHEADSVQKKRSIMMIAPAASGIISIVPP